MKSVSLSSEEKDHFEQTIHAAVEDKYNVANVIVNTDGNITIVRKKGYSRSSESGDVYSYIKQKCDLTHNDSAYKLVNEGTSMIGPQFQLKNDTQ